MTQDTERPLTVSGLMTKRAELIKHHAALIKEAKRVSVDIDTLEATIKLFGGDITTLRRIRPRQRLRASPGIMQRFVLDRLRVSAEPLTSIQLAHAFVQENRLPPGKATTMDARKKVGACLYHMSTKGLVVSGAGDGEFKGWRIKRND